MALTFDDGPDLHTGEVLDLLADFKVKATFFVIGEKVAANPTIVKRMVLEGHQVQNHSWSHPHLKALTPGQIAEEFSTTTAVIRTAGAPLPLLIRPPYGEVNDVILRVAASEHLAVIKWTVDTNDWRGTAPLQIESAVLRGLRPGAVVLMHDGLPATVNTLQALPNIIADVRRAGYCFDFPSS